MMIAKILDFVTLFGILGADILLLAVAGMLRDFGKGFAMAFSKKKYSIGEALRARKAMEMTVKLSWLVGGAMLIINVIDILTSMDISGDLAFLGPVTMLGLLCILYPIIIHIILLTVGAIIERKCCLQSRVIKTNETVLEQHGLTEREREVAKMVVEGASNKEIADTLFIAVTTVKKHLTNIFEKMQLQSREALKAKVLEAEQEQ